MGMACSSVVTAASYPAPQYPSLIVDGGGKAGAVVMSGGLVLPGGGDQGEPDDGVSGIPGTGMGAPGHTVSLALPLEIGAELDWGADAWAEVRTRAARAGRAYVWLNLVEQRLRAVVNAVLRP